MEALLPEIATILVSIEHLNISLSLSFPLLYLSLSPFIDCHYPNCMHCFAKRTHYLQIAPTIMLAVPTIMLAVPTIMLAVPAIMNCTNYYELYQLLRTVPTIMNCTNYYANCAYKYLYHYLPAWFAPQLLIIHWPTSDEITPIFTSSEDDFKSKR